MITDDLQRLTKLGHLWTTLLSKHSVAVSLTAEDRNEIAGRVYEARKAFDAHLADVAERVRQREYPTEMEVEIDTLLVCGILRCQVND